MIVDVAGLRSAGLLSPLDDHFARTLARLGAEVRPEVELAAALVSRHAGNGHVCLDLARLVAGPAPYEEAETPPADAHTWPALEAWLDALRASALVEVVDEAGASASEGVSAAPLVLDPSARLYLRRYWEHQQGLARMILARAGSRPPAVDEEQLEQGLSRLFDSEPTPSGETNLQRVAARTAVERGFTVISGGPGTGKTTTVVKILVLLIEQALAAGERPPRMSLVAPTGKAAAALAASIRKSSAGLTLAPEVREAIPDEASTIHRCLGRLGGSGRRFAHDARNPLATDLLLVDEASMVDLALMTRLLAAAPPSARVILLGDRDQLASVEAGAVLGDICNVGGEEGEEGEEGKKGEPGSSPLAGSVVQLIRSYRFSEEGGIGALARAVNRGDADAALALLDDPEQPELTLVEPSGRGPLADGLGRDVEAGYAGYLDAGDASARLEALGGFRVLAAHRRGPGSVDLLNREIEAAFFRSGRLAHAADTPGQVLGHSLGHSLGHYPGRPIMVTRNDYELGLYNGDLGVILPAPGESTPQAVFAGSESELRWLSPLRLTEVETVFAMSVHKSQGSEFDTVVLVLPDELSPVLSRELVYTGLSRARQRVSIYAGREVLREAIARRVERASGLREALWT